MSGEDSANLHPDPRFRRPPKVISGRVATSSEESAYRAGIDAGRQGGRGEALMAQTGAATAARREHADRQALRAHALRATGLSVPVIGIRMAREDGRPDDQPYAERQVRRWLSRPLKG